MMRTAFGAIMMAAATLATPQFGTKAQVEESARNAVPATTVWQSERALEARA